MTEIYQGELEIDHDRGVIYFHCEDEKIAYEYGSVTILRICNLPKPIPKKAIDITHMVGATAADEIWESKRKNYDD